MEHKADYSTELCKKLLEGYLERINANSLTPEETVLLMEMAVKHSLIGKATIPSSKDWLKYTFLGYYIYDKIIPSQSD